MKFLTLLFLTLTLSFSTHAADESKKAPSTDQSAIKGKTGQQKTYEGSDSISSEQSSTTRKDSLSTDAKACKDSNGSWIRSGDTGYATCMGEDKMIKR